MVRRRSGLYVPRAGGGSGYSAAVLADSPKGYWRQGEASGTTMVDSSGNGHNGTYNGTVTLGATGLTSGDTAATYGGGSGRVTYGSWMDGVGTFAVDCLIKPSSIASGSFNFIANASDAGIAGPWWLVLNSGKLEFLCGTSTGGFTQVTGATALSAGTTYHVGAIYNGSTAKVYVNAVEDGSASRTGNMQVTSKDLWIGNWQSASLPFAGVIDEVAIYASLTPTRLAAHNAAK